MKVIDFSRSFLTFRIDSLKKPPETVSHKPPHTLNNARIPIDCRCTITESGSDREYAYVLGVNCKTERVGVDRDIWTDPNADFVPIMSTEEFLMIKTFARVGTRVRLFPPSRGAQPDRQRGRVADAFDSLRIDIHYTEGEVLMTNERIVGAVLGNERLVGKTTLKNERYSCTLEYPMKTINANERDGIYQPDTGPVILPDLDTWDGEEVHRVFAAHAAITSFDHVEFILRREIEPADAEKAWLDKPRGRDRHELLDPNRKPAGYPPPRPRPTVYNETWELDAVNTVTAAENK